MTSGAETGNQAKPRAIRVFVSSTFKDMHAEREELVKRVFPQLRKRCEQRGVGWSEVDLRWGISDEQRAEGAVLPICLAEIQRCRPYFLCLLGERYGWIPDQLPSDLVDREPWLGTQGGRSVTELEILHGALNDPALAEHAFFYLRDPAYVDRLPAGAIRDEFVSTDAASAASLAALKERIRGSGLTVREDYADPRAFGALVLDDLTRAIDARFPADEARPPLAREAAEHEAFARSRTRVYIGGDEAFAHLDAHVGGTGPPLVVLGESGSGKSALLASWAARYRSTHPDAFVFTHFVGASPLSTDWASMLRRILTALVEAFDLPGEIPTGTHELRSAFPDGLQAAACAGGRPVVLILDALDRLEDTGGALDLTWLPHVLPDTTRVILSTLPGRPLEALSKRGGATLSVAPLTRAEKKELITRHLAPFAKTLETASVQRIVDAPQTANPLYLRALLEELRIHGSHRSLASRLAECLATPTIAALYTRILDRFEVDYEADRPGLVRDALSCLWASRWGLTESELLDLLGSWDLPLPSAYWSPLSLAAEDALTRSAGRIAFCHDHFRDAVRARYLPTNETQRSVHRQLATYFASRAHGPRRLDEEPWQLARAEAWQDLYDLLRDPTYVRLALDHDAFAVHAYWAEVESRSPLRMVDAYRALWEDPSQDVDAAWGVARLLREAHPEDARALWEQIVELLRRRPDLEGLSVALGNLAEAMRPSRQSDRALTLLEEQERLCREEGNLASLRNCLGNQATYLLERGDHSGARRRYEEEQALCRRLGDRRGLAMALGGSALIHLHLNRLDEAMRLLADQERLSREEGNLRGVLAALGNQGVVLQRRRDAEGARACHAKEEAICRELGDAVALATCLGNQAELLTDRGELDRADEVLEECETIARETGSRDVLQGMLGRRALVLRARGAEDEALAAFREQERTCREIGQPAGLQSSLDGQALIVAGRGEHGAALALLQEADSICRDRGDEWALAVSLEHQGASRLALGDFERAEAAFEACEEIARRLDRPELLMECLGHRAVLDARQDRARAALIRLAEAEALARTLGAESLVATCLYNQAVALARDLARPDRARPKAEEALRLAREHGPRRLLASLVPLVEELQADPRARPRTPPTEGDRSLLDAEPLPRGRMALLWMDAAELTRMRAAIEEDEAVTVVRADSPGGERHTVTLEDVRWTEGFASLQDEAQEAAARGAFETAVRLYRQALERAPGCDVFLMSLGVCYTRLGDPARGVRFLERAAELSPESERIRRNLESAAADLDASA